MSNSYLDVNLTFERQTHLNVNLTFEPQSHIWLSNTFERQTHIWMSISHLNVKLTFHRHSNIFWVGGQVVTPIRWVQRSSNIAEAVWFLELLYDAQLFCHNCTSCAERRIGMRNNFGGSWPPCPSYSYTYALKCQTDTNLKLNIKITLGSILSALCLVR